MQSSTAKPPGIGNFTLKAEQLRQQIPTHIQSQILTSVVRAACRYTTRIVDFFRNYRNNARGLLFSTQGHSKDIRPMEGRFFFSIGAVVLAILIVAVSVSWGLNQERRINKITLCLNQFGY